MYFRITIPSLQDGKKDEAISFVRDKVMTEFDGTPGLLSMTASLSLAQSIDLGRGELPVTVPENYNSETPNPLIILLHGYTSSGASQDSYMKFSSLADRYGFLFVAPDGNKEQIGRASCRERV